MLSPSDSLKPSMKPVIKSNADMTIVTGQNNLPNTVPKPFANPSILPMTPPSAASAETLVTEFPIALNTLDRPTYRTK